MVETTEPWPGFRAALRPAARRLATHLAHAGTHWLGVVFTESPAQARGLLGMLPHNPLGPSISVVTPLLVGQSCVDAPFEVDSIGPVLMDLVREDLYCCHNPLQWDTSVQNWLMTWNEQPAEVLGPGLLLVLPSRFATRLPGLAPGLWCQRSLVLHLPPPLLPLQVRPPPEPPLHVTRFDILLAEAAALRSNDGEAATLNALDAVERGAAELLPDVLERLSRQDIGARSIPQLVARLINLAREAEMARGLARRTLTVATQLAQRAGLQDLEAHARAALTWLAVGEAGDHQQEVDAAVGAALRAVEADCREWTVLAGASLAAAAVVLERDQAQATRHLARTLQLFLDHDPPGMQGGQARMHLVEGLLHARWGRPANAIQALDAAVVSAEAPPDDPTWGAAVHALLKLLHVLGRTAEIAAVLPAQGLTPDLFVASVRERMALRDAIALAGLCGGLQGVDRAAYRSIAQSLLADLPVDHPDHPMLEQLVQGRAALQSRQ